MSEELNALRVKVAELRRWTNLHWHEGKLFGTIPDAWEFDSQGALENYYEAPNYPSDLNACAELLQSMVADGWDVDIRNNHFNYPWSCLLWKSGKCERGDANELAEAICRAFVATMEGKEK